MFQQLWDFEKLTPKLAPEFETYTSIDKNNNKKFQCFATNNDLVIVS